MRKLAVILCTTFLLFFVYIGANAEAISGPFMFTPTLTNLATERSKVSTQQWLSTASTRAALSVFLLVDVTTDFTSANQLEFADFAELDTSYVCLQDDLLTVIYQGAGNMADKGIMLMYSPDDKDAAYFIYNLDEREVTYAILAKAMEINSELFYENDISEVMKIWKSIGDVAEDNSSYK